MAVSASEGQTCTKSTSDRAYTEAQVSTNIAPAQCRSWFWVTNAQVFKPASEPTKLTRLDFFLDFSCTRNAACYNCGPQPNQVIQITPGRQKSLQMARIGFGISKMRRRFGSGFMIGLNGLNVPAPAPF